jgi:hypothetical protein
VIKEADKGNAVVILDREYYRDKILDMLKDGMYYEETDKKADQCLFISSELLFNVLIDSSKYLSFVGLGIQSDLFLTNGPPISSSSNGTLFLLYSI